MLEGVSHHPAWELSPSCAGFRGAEDRGVGRRQPLQRVLLSFEARGVVSPAALSLPVHHEFPFQSYRPKSLLLLSFPGNWVGAGAQRQLLPFSRWPRKEFFIMEFQLTEKYVWERERSTQSLEISYCLGFCQSASCLTALGKLGCLLHEYIASSHFLQD